MMLMRLRHIRGGERSDELIDGIVPGQPYIA
jgi:hypothetical protein